MTTCPICKILDNQDLTYEEICDKVDEKCRAYMIGEFRNSCIKKYGESSIGDMMTSKIEFTEKSEEDNIDINETYEMMLRRVK